MILILIFFRTSDSATLAHSADLSFQGTMSIVRKYVHHVKLVSSYIQNTRNTIHNYRETKQGSLLKIATIRMYHYLRKKKMKGVSNSGEEQKRTQEHNRKSTKECNRDTRRET